MRYSKPLATSVFIAAMVFSPLAAFCDFGANDSQNLLEVKNRVNAIRVDTGTSASIMFGLADFLSLNSPISSGGNFTPDYTLFQVLTGNSPLSNFTPLLPSLDKISSALFYYDAGARVPYLDKLLEIASSLVSEKSGIPESLADLSFDIRHDLHQIGHDTTNALYDADLSIAQLLATNNYYLSMLVLSNNAAPVAFDMTNLLAMLSSQVVDNDSSWIDAIGDYETLAWWGVGELQKWQIASSVYPDYFSWSPLTELIDRQIHTDLDYINFDLADYAEGLAMYSTEAKYLMYGTYPLFTNSLQIISLLDSINNFTNIQALSFKEQKNQLNQQLQQFTGEDAYYSDNIETNVASISTNDVYETPDAGYLQGLTDNVLNDSSYAEIDSSAEGFFAKVKTQLDSANSSFNVGSPTLILHIQNAWHDETISLDYHLKSDARAKIQKFWDWIFTIVRWVLTLWAFTYLINLIVSHDKVERGASPEDIFR